MIAKRIVTRAGGSGFRKLAGYVLNVKAEHQHQTDPASWTRLHAYVLDDAHGGGKVAWSRATNVGTDDPGWAVKGILATQARNTRSQGDKSYHLVVSFPEGERPTREQMEHIEDRLAEAVGFGDHQRVSAVHQNTGNWHLHIAINKVHPVTFCNVSPWRDHFRLQEACAELEIAHGLVGEPHTVEPDRTKGRERDSQQAFDAKHSPGSFAAWVREHAKPALVAARESGGGWEELHRVAATFALNVRPRGAGMVIGHANDKRLHVKASEIDRSLAFKAITGALGEYRQPTGKRAAKEETPTAGYTRSGQDGQLYAAYLSEKQAAEAARKAALEELRVRQGEVARAQIAHSRERVRKERLAATRGRLRRKSFEHVFAERRRVREERVMVQAGERRETRYAIPVLTWRQFLDREAKAGRLEAIEALAKQRAERTVASTNNLARKGQEADNVIPVRHKARGKDYGAERGGRD